VRHEEDDTRPARVLIVQLYRWKASLGAQETPHFGSRRSHYKRRAFLEKKQGHPERLSAPGLGLSGHPPLPPLPAPSRYGTVPPTRRLSRSQVGPRHLSRPGSPTSVQAQPGNPHEPHNRPGPMGTAAGFRLAPAWNWPCKRNHDGRRNGRRRPKQPLHGISESSMYVQPASVDSLSHFAIAS
jgi:hypothetical protein